ncbi:MAG: hypothetical protein U0T69_11350 [Chitinophagales bacterium]
MEATIIIQGITANDFFKQIEEASYRGQQKAIEEEKKLSMSVDWDKYSDLLCVADLCEIFPIKEDTARGWITDKVKFGDYNDLGKLLSVPKSAVRKYYESTKRSDKR